MSGFRFLIDTNVFIFLEDNREILPIYSEFYNLCLSHGCQILVHDASVSDLQRDKNNDRQSISLSKLKKYTTIPRMRHVTDSDLISEFGNIGKDNDRVDAWLLHAIKNSAADFLVTEDKGIHSRANDNAPDISEKVFFINQALDFLKSIYGVLDIPVKNVIDVEASEINLGDPLFDGLRQDYEGFDNWWVNNCVKNKRSCWIVDEGHSLAALVVRKQENAANTDSTYKLNKILKLCTFKVGVGARGNKLGELLLKKVFWFAYANNYDVIYTTVFSKHTELINLLQYYGFANTGRRETGEMIFERLIFKDIKKNDPRILKGIVANRWLYPQIFCPEGTRAYVVPIKQAYHDELFPEVAKQEAFPFLSSQGGRAGNAIRKVYISRSPINNIESGSILLFYKCLSKENGSGQEVCAIGVAEQIKRAQSNEEVIALTAGRSVYTQDQLARWGANENTPVKVLNFLHQGYLKKSLELKDLKEQGIIKSPPQAITEIKISDLPALIGGLEMNFEI